jgi:hypothetical protein
MGSSCSGVSGRETTSTSGIDDVVLGLGNLGEGDCLSTDFFVVGKTLFVLTFFTFLDFCVGGNEGGAEGSTDVSSSSEES